MSRARTLARRGFLIGSAAVAGGVAFGVYTAIAPPSNPLQDGLAAGDVSFNPWVKITAERIVLITPHADVGQGAVHMQALLLAEEMDLELGQFETDFGPPAPAYYNSAMSELGVPFHSADQGWLAEATRDIFATGTKVMGLQVTGGSTSVSDSFDKLRRAGAIARETLKLAAAGTYGVTIGDLSTERGAVVLPDGRRVSYQALASQAANLEPVTDVVLRYPSEWRYIGHHMMRMDIAAKSTGQQDYGIDIQMDGMVHAALRLSPRRSAVIAADVSAAAEVPGVDRVLPVTNGFAVIASNTWSAFQGARAIEATWAPAAYPAEQAAHWQALEAAFAPQHLEKTWRDDGAVDSTIRTNAVEAEYRAPYVAHQPLEPLNATIKVTDTHVLLWTATQVPRFAQQAVARITGHDADQVILYNQVSGGSFGHRLELDHVKCAAEIAMQVPDTPVKLTYSREEDFAQDYPRHISLARARGVAGNGVVKALALDIAAAPPIRSQVERLGYPFAGTDPEIAAGAWNAPYALPDFRVRAYGASGLAPVSSWRSVGASAAGFFLESFLDELIHAAGADPMAERLRLCRWDVAQRVLEAAAEMSGWGRALPEGTGRGVALVESFGVPVAEVVEVTQTEQGIRLDNVWVAVDAGTVVDPVNFESQVEGGVIWGLGHAINSEITYSDGAAEQSNFHMAEGLRLSQTPQITVRALSQNHKIRGIGEPPVPPAAPALANAIFAATGHRLRQMPFFHQMEFL